MPRKLHKVIQDKFRKSRYTNVKEWQQASGCPLSLFSCTRIINQDTEPSLETALTMLYLLGTSTAELIEICKENGDKVFWRMMSPSDVSGEEMQIIEAIRKDPAKAEIVRQLLAL